MQDSIAFFKIAIAESTKAIELNLKGSAHAT